MYPGSLGISRIVRWKGKVVDIYWAFGKKHYRCFLVCSYLKCIFVNIVLLIRYIGSGGLYNLLKVSRKRLSQDLNSDVLYSKA